MTYCTSCGAPLSGVAFCTSCGAPVAQAAAPVPAPVPVPAGAVGHGSDHPAATGDAPPPPWATAPPGGTRGRSPLTIALAVLTVVLVGAAAVLLFQMSDDGTARVAAAPTRTPSSSPTEVSVTRSPSDEQVASPAQSFDVVPADPPSAAPSPQAALPATPFEAAIIASKTPAEGGLAAVQPLVREIEAAGYPALVFQSQDYTSLNCCYWVAAAGPFPDAASAASAAADMRTRSATFRTAYRRCVGQAEQCS